MVMNRVPLEMNSSVSPENRSFLFILVPPAGSPIFGWQLGIVVILMLVVFGCAKTSVTSNEPASDRPVPNVEKSASATNPGTVSDEEIIKRWPQAFGRSEQEFAEHRVTLVHVLSDPVFADQHDSIRSLIANADLIREEHGDLFLQAAKEHRREPEEFHFLCHNSAQNALFQVVELIKKLPLDSKQASLERIQDFMKSYQRNLSQWQPVLVSYSRAGVDLQPHYGASPQDLTEKLTESMRLAQSVPSHIAADDVVSAYIVQRNATLLMDVVNWGLFYYYQEVYKKSRPANP